MPSTGALVLNLFAALWAGLALHALGAPAWQMAAPAVVSLILTVWAFSRPQPVYAPDMRKRISRTVIWSSAIEGVVIFAAVNALHSFGRDDLTIPAIAAVVGAHFYPMAIGIKTPIYALTATAMLLLAAATAFLLPGGPDRDAVTGGGCALILWLSAMAITARRRQPVATA